MNLLELPWLPPAPSSFRTDLKQVRDAAAPDLAGLRRLAAHSLNLTQLTALARALPAPTQPPLPWLKLGILSNATVDLLPPAIQASGIRHDLWLQVHTSSYGSFMQDAIDPASALNQQHNHFVLLALDHRAFGIADCLDDAAAAQYLVDRALADLDTMVRAIASTGHTTVIVQTLPEPPASLFGSLDMAIPGTLASIIAAINDQLRRARPAGSILFDVARLAASVGLTQWHDASAWFSGKFPFAHEVVPLYADHVCRLLMAARGKARKCLVLDLDNTLWGGVIGDDGLSGIVIGQGNPAGEAHLALQAAAMTLRKRGIILAVSSKNDEAVARNVFQQHPDMLLREEHIAVFQANWQDKASNLKAIAETLNIGLDSLVFVDDNPAERQQVRLALPMVAVPELPQQPDHYASLLLAAGYFEALQFTADDRVRAEQYQANAARQAVLGDASNLGAYLESLEMRASIAPFDEVGNPRITQLINKTNQFNLTTERYTELEVTAIASDPDRLGLQIRLSDRFGDNGMISVIVCDTGAADWTITTWLMSCRVLNRKVEAAVLDVLAEVAKRRGAHSLLGIYRPSDRNSMVSEHYPALGFQPIGNEGAQLRWRLDLGAYQPFNPPVHIELHPSLAK